MGIPLLSVITPCYNQAKYLPQTLDSLLRQTYSDWECLIVNDCSPDNTEEVALSYCEKDSRFRYFRLDQNQGLCHARNFAVSHSKGRYLLPLDSDDWIEEGYIEDAVKTMENRKEVKVVYSQGEYFGEHTGIIELKPYSFETLLLENVFFNSVVFRREDYDRVGGYHDYMSCGFEDWEILLSILDEDSVVVKLPQIYYHYRVLRHSMLRSITNKQREMLFLEIYENHKEVYDRHFPNPMRFAYLNRQSENKISELQGTIESIKNSRKYRVAQSASKVADRLMFWKSK